MLGRMVRTESENHGAYTWPFEQTRDLLSSADITLINLENPITDPCAKHRATLIFCAPPDSVAALTYAGIDIANLANNHMLDKDIEGYASTLEGYLNAQVSRRSSLLRFPPLSVIRRSVGGFTSA